MIKLWQVLLLCLPLHVFADSLFDESETCTIKEPTACAPQLKLGDKSYTYTFKTQLNLNDQLKKQLSLYEELKTKLHQDPHFLLYVDLRPHESYEHKIRRLLKKIVKLPLLKSLKYLKDKSLDEIFQTVLFLPDVLRDWIYQELPLSRVQIAEEAYTEHTLRYLKDLFPQEIKKGDVLTKEQKVALVKYGALPVLVAQDLASNVHLKP